MIRRESSEFLRQKQKQWEREKADSENRSEWFPFGENTTPGGGSPLRKHAPKGKELHEHSEESEVKTQESSSGTMLPSNNSTQKCSPEKMAPAPPESSTYSFPVFPAYAFPYQLAPFQQQQQQHAPASDGKEPSDTRLRNYAQTTTTMPFFAPHYQVIPAGAIPVSTINIDPSQLCPVDQMGMWTMPPPPPPPPNAPNGMRYGIPIPAPFVPQITAAMSSSTCSAAVLNAIMSSSATDSSSSSESGVSGVKDGEDATEKMKNSKASAQHEERQSTSDYTDDDPIPLTRRSTAHSSGGSNATHAFCDYEQQIAERRRCEQEREDRERAEMLEVERQRRVLEDRRQTEEEKRKEAERERLEEDRRRADQFAAAMEKARKEAELLKRTKLYKHVLRGAEEEGGADQLGEMEQKLLGVDWETGRRLLKEVSEVEWHKKQDEKEISKKAPTAATNAETRNNTMAANRARSTSISSPSSPFLRNGVGRRSVRTTSREKQEITVVEPEHSINEQWSGARRPDPSPRPQSAAQNRNCEGLRRLGPSGALQQANNSEMLKSANFYCPINREPISYREKPTTTTTAVGGRHNEITQSALFGPIATRISVRRGQMRGIGMQSPTSVRLAQKSTRNERTSSFEESSSGGEDGGSISPELSHKNFESPLPSSTENVHPTRNSPPLGKNDRNAEIGGFEYPKTPRTRSALGTPMSLLNGGDSPMGPHSSTHALGRTSPSVSRLMQRLEQKGTVRRDAEPNLSEEVRRLAETNLSRSPSMASLRGSIQNLSIRGSHLNLAGDPSPNLSKFASVSSPARQSLTSLKKTTDRQTAVLERLSRLRESLHAGKNYTPPRGISSRLPTPSGTPPVSPRAVL
ncbi:unnamed protein product [Caenorhabditis sp. 36 PRJEB53466]|nr:unnamed protein product [Caenorhabditis sp. 36 PRJEB53466]